MKQNFTVRQGALDGVEAFLSVAQHRNFRRAAAELGVTPSAISQAIRALEARVGAALFIRTTRSVGLTEAGERFISRAKPAFEELVAASEAARDLGERPAGLLRLSVPRAVVPLILEPVIASFAQAYPEIELEIAASEELVDLPTQWFDAGIRLGQFIAADMIAVRLTPPFPLVVIGSPDYVIGSPDYLGLRKPPERIDDLRQHACLRMRRTNGSIAPWPFVQGNQAVEAIVTGPLIAHDYPTLVAAAIRGVGLAQMPVPLVKAPIADGRLQALLEPFAVTTPGVFLYYPSRRQVLPNCVPSLSTLNTGAARASKSVLSAQAEGPVWGMKTHPRRLRRAPAMRSDRSREAGLLRGSKPESSEYNSPATPEWPVLRHEIGEEPGTQTFLFY